jgi:hypothetical protein
VQIDQIFADMMIERAVETCAKENFSGNVRQMRQALFMGDCAQCRCVSSQLVKQIGEYLGEIDGTIRAVYQYEPAAREPIDNSPEDKRTGIHFIIWTARKSAALNTLVKTLEASLSASQRKLGCANTSPECLVLDMHVVDDRDVHEGRGIALLVKAPVLQAKRVWEQPEKLEEYTATEVTEPSRVRYALPDSFDPDLIPEARLIEHALSIERLDPKERAPLEHHLTELKVTLIRRIISDQLSYINIAKQWFRMADLENIFNRRMGFGQIGGKAAGMLLACRIIQAAASQHLNECIQIPESYFLGTDLMYIFMSMNGLMHWNDQKYKSEEEIRADYPEIQKDFVAGEFPPEIVVEFKAMLDKIGRTPLIVRSSSQLEDNLGTSFAGKYDSHFCPNQGSSEENLRGLTRAIAMTYASTFKPDALLYRRSRDLQDYDERMAILIQEVQGEKWRQYYMPFAAGVAFSRNLYRWAPQIRREDGFARLVWGLGTRAVQRLGNDYPRLVALSHPTLQPDDSPQAIRYYSQQFIDLIDLEENQLKTMPVRDVLAPRYPGMRLLAQVERDGHFTSPRRLMMQTDIPNLAVTYEGLLGRTPFARLLSEMLKLLEHHFRSGVDVEFTVQSPDPMAVEPDIRIRLLQCRPQTGLVPDAKVKIPDFIPKEDIIFSSHFMVPQGYLANIRYVLFIPPEEYFTIPTPAGRNELGRFVGKINAVLESKSFICIGPGRWGTENFDLGVYVGYADICNAGALVELSGRDVGPAPEPSLGTHFFLDLMEAQIYPIAIPLDSKETIFKRDFFYDTQNCLGDWIAVRDEILEKLRLIDVATYQPDHHIDIIMDDEKGQAVAYLVPDSAP